MTFLQYLCERIMGPPARQGGSYGESYWLCPVHDDHNPSFHTLPHKSGLKDRWKCFSCGAWGDEADLLKERLPGENWPQRRDRLNQWRQEYERETEPTPAAPKEASILIPFRGPGSGEPNRVYESDPREDGFSPEVNAAAAELVALAGGDSHQPATREKLLLIEKALEVCGRHRLHPLGLAVRAGFEAWTARIAAEHMAECSDPDCDWYCCRLARGWAPEQIRAELEAAKRRRDEERQRTM